MGIVVTAIWLIWFVLCAAAPLLGYRLSRRSSPARVALVVWLPAVAIVTVTIVGLVLSPP